MPNTAPILETKRLVIRHFVMDDLDSLLAFYSDLDGIKHIPDAPRSYDEKKEELEWHMNGRPNSPKWDFGRPFTKRAVIS